MGWDFNRKGQATIFVILGLVLLIIVVFVLFLVTSLTTTRLSEQATQAVRDYMESRAISYYVYTCMETGVNDAVSTMALQGGVFFDYQNGSTVSGESAQTHIPFTYNFAGRQVNLNVSYAVQKQGTAPLVLENVPDYPYGFNRLSNLESIYEDHIANEFYSNLLYTQSGFFGLNNFTRLCYPGSKNSVSTGGVFSPCLRSLNAPKNYTVEHELSRQISQKVEGCINFSIFNDLEGHNITVVGEPNTTILLNDRSFTVQMEYPFNVKLENREPILVKHVFEYSTDLRVTKLQNYLLRLFANDTKNIFFDMANDYRSVEGYDNFMDVKVINFTGCNCQYENDQILILKDSSSKIGNDSLTYLAALKNRNPALDMIHETTPAQYFDIIAPENTTITIAPFGYDPDDIGVSYNYIGWKETFDEQFICTFPVTNLANCIIQLTSSPHKWTTSSLFESTSRSASYETNRSDIGPHNLTVMAIDPSGLFDFQVVRILVYDLPQINFTINKTYPDIPAGAVSIEDAFVLMADGSLPSQFGGGNILEYIWEGFWSDTSLPVGSNWIQVFVNRTDIPRRSIPLELFNIQNITLVNLSHVGLHELKLTITQFVPISNTIIEHSVSSNVNSYECLPHRSNIDAYPYNTGNPFYSNHTCCAGNPSDTSTYSLATSSTVCFADDAYGEFGKLITHRVSLLRNALLSEYYSIRGSQSFVGPSSPARPGKANDVYRMSFTRKCDGNRGNICAGDAVSTFSVHSICSLSGPDEKCSGPSLTVSENPVSACTTYVPGTSFETTFGLPSASGTADGVCNEASVRSSIGVSGYGNAAGKLRCTATCSTGTFSGQCVNTRASECVCVQAFGATCYPGHTSSWIGKECKFGCDVSNTCEFLNSATLPCTASNNFCLNTNTVGYVADTCYYGVTCSDTPAVPLAGQYCKKGGIEVDAGGNRFCLWAPSAVSAQCSSAGVCSLTRTQEPNTVCGPGLSRSCNPTSGWSGCV